MFLDAIVIRCVMLPAVLELLGKTTWKLPKWIDRRLPHINIEGDAARRAGAAPPVDSGEPAEREREPVGS